MQILLRDFNDRQYEWFTASYNENGFVVDDVRIYEYNIVSVMNDNRKNYVKCSSCGKIVSKNEKKFDNHKRNASSCETCFNCPSMRTRDELIRKIKYTLNKDGEATRQVESSVKLVCCRSFYDTTYPINSPEAVARCKKRQCANAKGIEISDIFTQMPGVFDDIITIDKILDNGYARINYMDYEYSEYVLNDEFDIQARVNSLNIVDRFVVEYEGYYYNLWYSKKYDEFFTTDDHDKYCVWKSTYCQEDQEAIKAAIRKYYN